MLSIHRMLVRSRVGALLGCSPLSSRLPQLSYSDNLPARCGWSDAGARFINASRSVAEKAGNVGGTAPAGGESAISLSKSDQPTTPPNPSTRSPTRFRMKLPQNTSTISAPATGSTAQSLKVTPSPAKPSPLTDFNTVPVPVPGPIKLGTWGDDTKKALSLIYHQPSYYAIVEIKQRPYHVHLNDVVITMRMNDCKLGDVLQLDRVREIGSMEYILQGNPYLHPDYIDIKAVVIEHPAAKEVVRQHWKKRGHDKIVRNRSHHTALRISEINIKKPPPT